MLFLHIEYEYMNMGVIIRICFYQQESSNWQPVDYFRGLQGYTTPSPPPMDSLIEIAFILST